MVRAAARLSLFKSSVKVPRLQRRWIRANRSGSRCRTRSRQASRQGPSLFAQLRRFTEYGIHVQREASDFSNEAPMFPALAIAQPAGPPRVGRNIALIAR